MKKIIRNIALVFLMVMLGPSCSKDYLVLENRNSLLVSSFWKTQNDAWMALNTCYGPIAFGAFYGNGWFVFMQGLEDRVIFESMSYDNFSFDATNSWTGSMYTTSYMGVWRCCDVIKNIQSKYNDPTVLKEADKKSYIAQAKAFRALYYFYQVILFHSPYFYDDTNMPLDYTTAYGNSEPKLFWDKIKEDCQAAVPDLPVKWGDADVGRITQGAVKALLGKAMLYKHYHYYVKNGQAGSADDVADLTLAKQMLNEVISSGTYQLVTPQAPYSRKDFLYSFGSNFTYVDLPAGKNLYKCRNTSESIWEIQYSDERIQGGWLPAWQWTGSLMCAYLSPHVSSYKNEEFHPDMWNAFEKTVGATAAAAGFDRDPRAYATIYIDGDTMDVRPESPYYKPYLSGANNKKLALSRGLIPATGNPYPTNGFGLKKYFFPVYYEKDAPRNDPVNIPLIRLADVKLMYAEVQLLLDNDGDGSGLAQLNTVRARVDMPPVTSLTRAAIMHERDVELAQEGHRLLDLIRWSLDPAWGIDWYKIFGANVFTVGKNEYLPIPLGEITLNNGALKQNPGY